MTDPMQLFDERRKVSLITGASGAFGAVAARVLAGAGCRLVLAAGYSAYCASKSAVDGMTRALGCGLGRWGSPSTRLPRRCSAPP